MVNLTLSYQDKFVNIGNSLPNWVVDVQSVDLFKVRLDRFWAEQEVGNLN